MMEAATKNSLRRRESFFQKTVYHILPESNVKRMVSVVFIANANLPKEKTQVVLTGKELNRIPDDSTNILRNQILTSTLIDPMHYLLVENIILQINFATLKVHYITVSIINQVIHLSINRLSFKINYLSQTMRNIPIVVDEISEKNNLF